MWDGALNRRSNATTRKSGVAFLDFDGVLHPYNSGRFNKVSDLAEYLNTLELEGIAVKVVITSTWRLGHSIEELKSWLEPSLCERVIGTTLLEQSGCSREEEILICLAELQKKFSVLGFVALDDCADLFPSMPKWLVLTDPSRGLVESNLLKVREILCSKI